MLLSTEVLSTATTDTLRTIETYTNLGGIPMQPIVSFRGSPTYQLFKHLTTILQPLTDKSGCKLQSCVFYVKSLLISIPLQLAFSNSSSYPTRASYSGQVDGFRNPMKIELKITAYLEIILNTDANFLNLHIYKARKTHDDKQLFYDNSTNSRVLIG